MVSESYFLPQGWAVSTELHRLRGNLRRLPGRLLTALRRAWCRGRNHHAREPAAQIHTAQPAEFTAEELASWLAGSPPEQLRSQAPRAHSTACALGLSCGGVRESLETSGGSAISSLSVTISSPGECPLSAQDDCEEGSSEEEEEEEEEEAAAEEEAVSEAISEEEAKSMRVGGRCRPHSFEGLQLCQRLGRGSSVRP